MTFDEWYEENDMSYADPRTAAESAWSAATIAERERCALIAEDLAMKCISEIRRGE